MAPQRAKDAPVVVVVGAADGSAAREAEAWAVLRDHVVVYTAKLGSDGEPGSTVVPWPGARAFVRIAGAADGSVGAFRPEAVVEDERDGLIRGVWLPTSADEPVLAGGRPVRVADVPTTGCPLPALTRQAMLGWLRRRLAPDADPASFRALLHRDLELRGAVARMLRRGLDRRRPRAARAA
jgi:hypothetical protein